MPTTTPSDFWLPDAYLAGLVSTLDALEKLTKTSRLYHDSEMHLAEWGEAIEEAENLLVEAGRGE